MKLKQIKPGMVIHCPEQEQAEELLKHLSEMEYKWAGGSKLTETNHCLYRQSTCYEIYDIDIGYGSIEFFQKNNRPVTEFSDLIQPELTAAEAIAWLGENYIDGEYEKVFGKDYHFDKLTKKFSAKEIVEKIEQHLFGEETEPEYEHVDICRIIEIQQDGKRKCVQEVDIPEDAISTGHGKDEIERILKEYSRTHSGRCIAVQEVVCREKQN